jgi:hypothetical protein
MRPPRWPLVTAALLLVSWNLFLLTMVFYGN